MWVLVLDELGLTRLLKGKCFRVYMTTWKISTSLQQICDSSDAELRLPLWSTDFGLKHNWTLTLSSLVSSETVNRPSVRQTGRHLNLNQVRCVLRLLQLQQLETDFLWTSDWRVDFWKTKNLYFHIINSASAHPPGLSGLSAEPCLVLTDGSIGSVCDPTPSPRQQRCFIPDKTLQRIVECLYSISVFWRFCFQRY